MAKEIKKAAFLFLAFLLTGIGLEIHFSRFQNFPQRTILTVNEVVQHKISTLHAYLDDLMQTQDFRDRIKISGQELYEEEGLAFIVTRNDSVVFWSTNHIPDADPIRFLNDTTGIIKLSNGYYYYDSHEKEGETIHGLFRVKNDYPYSNEYLIPSFQHDLGLPDDATISLEEGEYNVFSSYGQFLFSVEFASQRTLSDINTLLLLFIYSLAFIALICMLYLVYEKTLPAKILGWLPLLFVVDVGILRWVLLYFELPPSFYDSPVFGPYYFASSGLNRSLGDAFINNVFLFTAAYLLYFRYKPSFKLPGRRQRYALMFVALLLIAITYFLLVGFYENFIRNSSLSLSLDRLFNFSVAGFLGLLTLSFGTFSFFFFSARLIRIAYSELRSARAYMILVFSTLVLVVPFTLPLLDFNPIIYIFLAVYLLSYIFILEGKKESISLPSILMILLLFSFLANYELYKVNSEKEKEYRKLIAEELTIERNPMVEFEFRKTRNILASDTNLLSYMTSGDPDESLIASVIKNTFSEGSWKEYEVQITVCSGEDLLEIQPEGFIVNCHDYFDDLIDMIGKPTLTDNLYFLEDKSENSNYIAVLDLPGDTARSYKAFIELYSFVLPEEGPGYPELLIDRSVNIKSDLSNYSYARYRDDKLTYKYGSYTYRINLLSYGDTLKDGSFYSWNGHSHYVHSDANNNILIISKEEDSWLDRIAPFSYLFLLFGLISLVVSLSAFFLRGKKVSDLMFSDRFQITVLSIVVISFIVIGYISERYVISLHDKKNRDLLNEKTLSVLTEVEHKLGDIDEWTPELRIYLSDQLNKFSSVFFSDINFFDTQGALISSSRPQIFDEGLISHRMDPNAYLQLHYDQKLQLIQIERIGQQEYLSSYIPFRNNEDMIMGYLNLPYFARQKELRTELMNFLVAFVNIYVLMIVLAIIITIFISRYLTKPLQLIKEKIGQTKLGSLNEKIDWSSEDEIGSLVREYNRMLDELAASAQLLARSERESAWREMAQQIAHEIKNPLTPMKLSVQHLKKAWDDKQPDWEQRFEKFTRMIVEQIEALSAIASEFSDFAKMPQAKTEYVDLRKSIQHAVNLYEESENITFRVDLPEDAPMWVIGDKEQFIRVFNNLIKNSIQAIGRKPDGRIDIHGSKEAGAWKVIVTDNGSGIPEEMSDKIFSPNFTTKSSGMGLGLAVVQSIIRESGGSVRFESLSGKGTSFYIYLPVSGHDM